MKKENKKIKAKEFDRVFDQGHVLKHLDLKSTKTDFPSQGMRESIRKGLKTPIEKCSKKLRW